MNRLKSRKLCMNAMLIISCIVLPTLPRVFAQEKKGYADFKPNIKTDYLASFKWKSKVTVFGKKPLDLVDIGSEHKTLYEGNDWYCDLSETKTFSVGTTKTPLREITCENQKIKTTYHTKIYCDIESMRCAGNVLILNDRKPFLGITILGERK